MSRKFKTAKMQREYDICKLIGEEYKELALELLDKHWRGISSNPKTYVTFIQAMDDLAMGHALEKYAVRSISGMFE